MVNKTVKEGALVQLSGLSGIGKTTLFRILAGLIKPDRGFFCVGDKILLNTEKNINLPPQQRNIALMFQEYALFPNMTVWENIAFAQKQKDPAYISQLLENFKMEQLKNRKVTQLSGGQQQRLAFARILLRNPKLIFLDEATSSLDSILEHKIIQTLEQEYRHLTKVMIAHRLSTVQDATQIYFLEDGKITGVGTHSELLESHPHYQEFVKKQMIHQ